MQQAAELGGLTGEKWQKYGVPPPELAAKIEQSMSEGGGYAVSDEGTSEGKQWKVLQEVTKTSEKPSKQELEVVM